ncbi:MAG: hypothetical protein PHH68_03065 [Candidatus Omnitrophica bacterium]|nr:hypothetical protein [Candidatus Omnitrophota bacterium]MDD5079288.1 hypothetical protein [Candidatus Omnitrophota bacterium]
MKRRGAFVLFLAVLAAGSLPTYYIFKYKSAQDGSNKVVITQEKAVAELEVQVRQLKEALKALEISGAGEGAVSLKAHMAVLQERLNESVEQNKELAGKIMMMTGDRGHLRQIRKTLDQAVAKNNKISAELAFLKNKLDFARPLDERLSRVGNALMMINAKQVKDKQIKMQLEALVDELSAINTNVAQLFGPESGFTDNPGALSAPLTVLSGQAIPVTWSDTYQTLKSELNRVQDQMNGLNKRYQDALETIRINQTELSKRAEKILSLQEKLDQVEAKLALMRVRAQETTKESAVLREQFVYAQLERERLIAELNETKSELNELQGKFSRIGNIFGNTGWPGYDAKMAIPASQKINVELIPKGGEGNATVKK